jgi:hypothetical protein
MAAWTIIAAIPVNAIRGHVPTLRWPFSTSRTDR